MTGGSFDEPQMMFAITGSLIAALMQPGINMDRIKMISTAIMKASGLPWQRVLINIALATDETELN